MTETIPTVVLVHGAFADAASWSGVVKELQSAGVPVLVPANPLRSLSGDSAYIASVVAQIDGPVVLVGHSYGGAIITVAGVADNVVGLVYVAAYVLEEGESLGELQGGFPDTPLASNLKEWSYPGPDGEPAAEFTINTEAFPEVFAADVPEEVSKVLAVAQRPLTAAAFGEKATAAAWKTKPTWLLVSGADNAINPEVERLGGRRSGATVIEVEGASHAVALSHPATVADLILKAVRAAG